MASRPLPPGRRGRGPRVASGLHNLPEIKLLDVPEAPSAASVSLASPANVSVVDTPAGEKAPLTRSSAPEAQAQQPPAAVSQPAVSEPLSVNKVDESSVVDSPVPAPVVATEPAKHSVHDVIAKLEERQHHVEQHEPTTHSYHSHGYAVHAAVATALPVEHKPIVKPAPAVLIKTPTVAPAYVPKTVAAPAPVAPAATISPPTLSVPAPVPVSTPAPAAQPEEESANLGQFHPFYLLLPVDAVPEVPETVECIYDDAALEMQKNVVKVIKKLLGKKNKMKLEDFKINSRLFGNNFMEPYEYLDSIVKDFGGIRALQLIPCLLMIQVDFMKRSGLLLAARNYRMRNIAALEVQCQAMRAAQAPGPATPVPQSNEPQPAADPAPLLNTNPDAAEAAVVLSLIAGVGGDEAAEKSDSLHEEDVGAVEAVEAALEPIAPELNKKEQAVDPSVAPPTEDLEALSVVHVSEEAVEEGFPDTSAVAPASLDVVSPSFQHVQKEPEAGAESSALQVEETHSSQTLSAVVEPIVESAKDVIQSIHELESIQKSVEAPVEDVQTVHAVELKAPEPKVEDVAPAPVAVATTSADAADFQSLEDLLPPEFREAFASSSGLQSEQVPTVKPASVHSAETSSTPQAVEVMSKSRSSVSSSNSFTEAENLFGERFSTGSTSSDNDNAGTLFGESFTQPASTATTAPAATATGTGNAAEISATHPAPKRVHSQLLFGFSTAGADTDSDSDSDGSDF